MCGIAGIFNLDGQPVSPVALRKMTDAVAHRGPDGEGFFIDSFLGLGHRRLAIIDLSPAGHQPRVSPCGNYAITWAYKHAPATLLGPFEFTALLWAVTFGIVFFGEIPSVYTLIGAAIIIGACLVVVQPTATSARTMPDDAGP